MNGFTKLFGSILDSTIWRESKETRLVWVTMMAMADRDGVVNASVPGLADRAKVSIDECQAALGVLSSPDEWSRSKEHGGRRIADCDGGWVLLNYQKYRAKQNPDEIKEKARLRQAKFRSKKKAGGPQARERDYERRLGDGEAS